MTVPAYAFYNPENVQLITNLIKRSQSNPPILFFCTHEYVDARKQYIAAQQIIKYNKKIIKNPTRFVEGVNFYLENKDAICDYLYRIKNKSKRIPYYNLKELFIKSINILNTQVDTICKIKVESVQREEVPEMISIVELIKRLPLTARVHLCWIVGFSAFLMGAGIMDLLGHAFFNIKAPAIFFGLIFSAQVLFYFIKPERWFAE